MQNLVQIGNIKSVNPSELVYCLAQSPLSWSFPDHFLSKTIHILWVSDHLMGRDNWFTAHGGLSSIEVLLEFSPILPHVLEQLSAMKALQVVPLTVRGISA